jgi:hypothetical protein
LDSIHHRLNHERDMTADVNVNITTDIDIDMVIDMNTDMANDVNADSPCFHGPVSSDPNIFGLLII